MSRKKSFFEFWRRKEERGELLKRADQLKLHPSQLRLLLSDSGVQAALQNTRMVSLLPPVGTEVFRRFTPASLGQIQQQDDEREKNKELEKELPKPARELEAGKSLPFIYGDPPPKLLNTPLEELDPYYQSQKTFIVLGKGNIIQRFNADPACYLLSPFSPLRTVAIKILNHSLFSLFIMLTILTNCVFMTMSNPAAWTNTVEHVFMVIYTSEVIIKVVSRGFCVGNFTFLRNPWNWLDVMVISTGYLTVFVNLGKVSVLRTVPRVLKIITIIPGLKTAVVALVQSVKQLAGVIVLTVFWLSVFALIGLQLFMGYLKHKCVIMPPSNMTFDIPPTPGYYGNESSGFDFNKYINDPVNYYFLPDQHDPLLCGNSSEAGVCPEGYVCLKGGRNPNYGFTSYDTFGWSLLVLFRLMTKDFWENVVLMTLRAAGKTSLTFFAAVVFPGCFCLLSLVLVVVTMVLGDQEEARVAEAKQKEEVFSQIQEVLKKREEEEQLACRMEPLTIQDVENKKSLEQKHAAMEVGEEDQRLCPLCGLLCTNLLLKWKCCGCWRWLKQRLYAFITNPFFDHGITFCLLCNTIFLAMEHYPMTMEFEELLSVTHLVFTVIFTAEMVFKLVAMDLCGYFQVGWNIFDSIVVAIGLLELTMFDVLRCFRLMRVFRLARWWPEFHMLLKIIWTSVRALGHLTVILLVMVFIFAIVGMQLFHNDYEDCVCRIALDCQLPRWHMNDFFHASLLIVRIFCGEWIESMWDCMEVSGQTRCLIFFMMVVVIGNILVLNLFLALLLSSFPSNSLKTQEEKEKKPRQVAISRINKALWALLGKKKHVNPDPTVVDSREDKRREYLALNLVTSDQPTIETPDDDEDEQKEKECANVQKHPEVQQDEDDEDHNGNTPVDCCSQKCYHCCPILDMDQSQGGGRVWSNFRRTCFVIVQHRYFETFMIIIILLSSVALVFEDVHLPQRQVIKTVVEKADQVFTCLFLLEMLLKWIGFGLKKYFTNVWCWLDFLILHVSLVCLTADTFGFFELGAISSLRALIPLRALSRFQGLVVVVQTLVRTIPSMFSVLLVCLTVWLIFGILGINLFSGKFYYCFNETSEEVFLPEQVNNMSDCLFLMNENHSEVRWKNAEFNYNNVVTAYLSLLIVETSAEWLYVMYTAVDATQVESQPAYESHPYMYLYFVCFIIISSFFTFNLFIRVIINKLQSDKFEGKPLFMTDEQQKYYKTLKKLSFKRPQTHVPRPQNQCQARLFDLVTRPSFEVFIVVLICMKVVAMMVETHDQSFEKEVILYWLHFLFFIIFFTEMILKIIALRRHYFTDSLNNLDFVVIILSVLGIFLSDLMEHYFFSPNLFFILRLARISRILHLIRCTRGIQKLLLGFMKSLPALFNIGLLLFIIIFTFSVFGMFNFAYVKKEAMIDDMCNFETFGNSMICLITITTSAGWKGLLSPIMNTPPDCDPTIENPGVVHRGNCGSPTVGIVFVASYIILSFLLVVHLYVAVVLETFSAEESEPLCDSDLQMFYKTWRKFDPDVSQVIQYSKLSDFCDTLQNPLRIPKPNIIKLIHMDLPLLPGDKIHWVDVFLALAAQVSGDAAELDALKARMEERFMANSTKVSYEPISSTLQRKREEVAAAVIQRAYRKHLLLHKDDKEDGGGGLLGV